MNRRVVITGMGAVSPIGNNKDEIWQNCRAGVCGIAPLRESDLEELPIKLAGEVKNLVMEEFLEKREIKFASKFCNFARIAAKEACADANLSSLEFDKERMGVFISSSIGGETLISAISSDQYGPYFVPSSAVYAATAAIARDAGAHGSCMTLVSACAGGANAIGEAYLKIKNGEEDIMIAGGADSAINRAAIKGFAAMRALYTGTDRNRASIPFDSARKGFVPAEGAAVLILEEYEQARSRGAHIYGEITGYGCTNDAFHLTAPREDGFYSAKAMQKAMKEAGISPNEIDYINAHGTGTRLNDLAECKAIGTAFGKDYRKPFVSSTKSMTGHMLATAGAFESLVCLKALEEGFIPATVNIDEQDENCDINLVTREGFSKNIQYVMNNSFGFGGFNVSLIFRRMDQ